MNTVIQITRVFIFLVLTSFASSAWSVIISSELGGASLDGAWSFGCSDPDIEEGGIYDEQEFLVYQGNTVDSIVYLYASNNESCSGGIVGVESEGPFDFVIEGAVEILGWLGEDENENEVLLDPPPERQGGGGFLNPNPLASIEIFKIPEEPDEVGCAYIDDTDQSQNGLNWYLYRCAGEDDQSFIPFLDTLEPLIKSELPVSDVPAPASIWLFGTGLIGFIGFRKRRQVT